MEEIKKLLSGLEASSGQNVVPFGKHKGQPMEVLRSDPDWCQWALDNGVVSETKYRNVYVFLTGAQGESHDTPEHNRYQVMFLDPDFAGDVFDRLYPDARDDYVCEVRKRKFHAVEKRGELEGRAETLRRDLKNANYNPYTGCRPEFEEEYRKKYARQEEENRPKRLVAQAGLDAVESQLADIDRRCALDAARLIELDELPKVTVEFEVKAKGFDGRVVGGSADVQMECVGRGFRIEIKPSMGDDYPAVLRQMKANYCSVLYLGSYSGSGATLDQVEKVFAMSRVKVLMHRG